MGFRGRAHIPLFSVGLRPWFVMYMLAAVQTCGCSLVCNFGFVWRRQGTVWRDSGLDVGRKVEAEKCMQGLCSTTAGRSGTRFAPTTLTVRGLRLGFWAGCYTHTPHSIGIKGYNTYVLR